MIEDYRAVMAQRAVFQSVASMGLPAFTIHSIVRYSGRALKDAKNTRIRSYGPIGVCSWSFYYCLFGCCWISAFPTLDISAHIMLTHGNSLVWPLCLSYRLSSTSQWSRLWSGASTKGSRRSGDRKLYAIVQ